jgi:hypothetical protein
VQIIGHPLTASAQRAELCANLASSLNEKYQAAFVVLDSSDYTDASNLLDEFRDIAFSWTPDRTMSGVPSYLTRLMQEAGSDGLVWMSAKTDGYQDTIFSWVLLHEFRHLYQVRHGWSPSALQQQIRTLRRRPEFIQLPPHLFQPAEIDAELFALDAMRSRDESHDPSTLTNNLRLPRCPLPAYNAFLLAAREQWIS